jgi:hypothetical protein
MINPPVVIFNNNPCFVTSKNFYNSNKYIGNFILNEAREFMYWDNTNRQYEFVTKHKFSIKNIEKHKIFSTIRSSESEIIPECTEIIFDYMDCPIPKKIPEQLKIYCCFRSNSSQLNNLAKLNFPIGLEYFCLRESVDTDIVNKFKLPFGCKLIKFTL